MPTPPASYFLAKMAGIPLVKPAKPSPALDAPAESQHDDPMGHRFTSLGTSIEKLLEAEYFLGGVASSHGDELRYHLNAFLAACRSVTFYLQKSMSSVPDFKAWYSDRQAEMRADTAMRFFLELRNISQHEGPVLIVGGSTLHPPGWTYRFAGNRETVPEELVGTSVARACADQLVKLARLVDAFRQQFPHESCLYEAFTADGINRLGFSLEDVAVLLGLPPGYLDVGPDIPVEEKLRILRREVDRIDSAALDRLTEGRLFRADGPLVIEDGGGNDLADDIAALVESGQMGRNPRVIFLHAIGHRIKKHDDRA